MEFLGLTIARTKALQLQAVDSSRGGWWPWVSEPFGGAWQRNMELRSDHQLAYFAVYACVSLIASDIAKMRVKLVEQDTNGIWTETESPAFSPILRKPNRYQTRVKFYEWWLTSKLIHGNTYALKQRDTRGVVTALYILDATRVKVLVAPDGAVFYELRQDNLSGLEQGAIVVPAREIIHDIMCALFHPLIGVSPLFACATAATQGLRIQQNSSQFFQNGSQPSGVVSAPGFIKDETAKRIKDYWETAFSGDNVGKVAVLGDGLKYEQMSVTAVDAQLIEQLRWTGENVCSCFHVPPYMIGVGPPPNYNNIEALNQQYYAQCLQTLIESLEICLDEGLELPKSARGGQYGTEFDLDDLIRMDTATKVKAVSDSIGGGFMTSNEGRKKFDLKPVEGGDTVYMQQQNYSLEALNRRDQAQPAPSSNAPALPPASQDDNDIADDDVDETAAAYSTVLRKALEAST